MKAILKLTVAVAIILLAAVGGLTWWLSGSSQPREGTLRLPGLKAPVTVARDEYGVPRLVAANADDAYFALGFIHAQDRLWQMEMQRRLGAGRLAEVIGEKALPTDKFMRTLGLHQLAEQSFQLLVPEVRHALESYAAGVNAYLTHHSGPLPAEFLLLRFTPEPWKPADSLVWGRLMALQLSGNWWDKLLRARLLRLLPPAQVTDLWPAYPHGGPTTLGLSDELLDHMLGAIPDSLRPRLASNLWVVSGDRSETGKPLLANDPHLDFQAPILWYLAVIEAPGLALSGATVPGVPFHLLGHNRRIAWGITTTSSDTMDLFIEKPAGGGYLTPNGAAPFQVHDELIRVHGSSPVTITVRQTRHGPIISDLLGDRADGQLLALSATALDPDDRTAQSFYRLNRAGNWAEFNAALEDFQSPQQNIAYADVDGHIGMVSPGRVPIRKNGDGSLPRPGWSGKYDWTGWVPFDALPRVFDPPSGIIVNANNKVVPDDYPYLLTSTWPEPYRAERIIERLNERRRHSVDDMMSMQMDETSLMARELKPLLLEFPPHGKRAAAAYAILKTWSGVTSADLAAPLIFETWALRLQQELLSPWLRENAGRFHSLRPLFLKAVLSGRTVWCGAPGQRTPPDCAQKVAEALDHALDDIARRYGADMSQWKWGEAHQAVFDAMLYRYIPVLSTMTRLSAATGGDDFTVQRGSFLEAAPGVFHNVHGAGMRAVYDLADLDDSRFVIATGQSGSPLSPHWGDLLDPWRQGETITLPRDGSPPQVLVLEPSP